MVSLATDTDRTLYFDYLPVKLLKLGDMTVKLQLYTVPGQVYYGATRKLVLNGADGVVFVADSQAARLDANTESLDDLNANLAEQGRKLSSLPHAFQWNKRDLPELVPAEELDRAAQSLRRAGRGHGGDDGRRSVRTAREDHAARRRELPRRASTGRSQGRGDAALSRRRRRRPLGGDPRSRGLEAREGAVHGAARARPRSVRRVSGSPRPLRPRRAPSLLDGAGRRRPSRSSI